MPAACPTSDTDPGIPAVDFGSIAEYSTVARPQGASCTGFRAFASTGLPQYDSQSYEFFGHLVDSEGNLNSIALMSQGNTVIPGLQIPQLTMEQTGLIFNRLNLTEGPSIGGMYGVAELSVPVSMSYQPWGIHVEHQETGKTLQNVDMRVASGSIGAVGSTYDITVALTTGLSGTTSTEETTLQIRARDLTGFVQWGYGPNGFFPLWMFNGTPLDTDKGFIPTTDQRGPIMDSYGGDIGAYLSATGDPMTGQGSQYYSMPLVQVEEWTIAMGDTYVAHGSDGLLFFDYLTETYNDTAQHIVGNGYSWTEFSVQLPDSLQGMLIAVTGQEDVGELYYAMLAGAGSTQRANGTLEPTANWPQGSIHITPVPNSSWVSRSSCYVYDLSYRVQLDASESLPAADLTFSATIPEQELNALGRSVYEGLFNYTGTLDGKPVSGHAWGEIQGRPPAGGATPPDC